MNTKYLLLPLAAALIAGCAKEKTETAQPVTQSQPAPPAPPAEKPKFKETVIDGVAGFQDKHKPPQRSMQKVPQVSPLKSGPAKPSPVPKQGAGGRASGHPGAHRLGSIKPLKLKV